MTPSEPDYDPEFDPRTPLVRAAHVSVELEASGRVHVAHPEGGYRVIPHGLEILTRFEFPMSAAEVLEGLALNGARDWVLAYEGIRTLHAAGLLHEPGQPALLPPARGYEGTPVHARMLNDRTRTDAFIRAIEATVRPEDVVVDIGTGTGILAMAAARAGARRVFAIEASSIADAAEAIVRRNGFADRITVVRGVSLAVTLPELADVIVTEMLGHHALGEGLLGVVADARARHGRAGARVIPRGLTVLALPVEIPPDELAEQATNSKALADWKRWYGFDLGPLDHQPGLSSFLVRPKSAAHWPALSEPAAVIELDLERVYLPAQVTGAATAVAHRSGELSGLVLGMRAQLADGIAIETLPGRAAPDNHWKCPVWLPRAPFRVVAGQTLRFRYSHGETQHARGEFAEVTPEEADVASTVGDETPPTAVSLENLADPLSGSCVVERAPGHLAALFGSEIAVASPVLASPSILDSTGAAIWRCLETPSRIDELCAALAEEFDLAPAECEADVIEFVEDLRAKGLVRIVS